MHKGEATAFTFKLNYQLPGDGFNPKALVERLGEVGCNDTWVDIGQPGRLALEFMREADNAFAEQSSAFADVRKAIPTAKFIGDLTVVEPAE